jgi:cation diffusion facilitator CzcD-associated flavoprotein CzcO
MVEEVYGVGYGQHIPAAVLHRYLTDFAKEFSVFEKVRFNTKVTTIEATPSGGWKIHVTNSKSEGCGDVLETEKLIVATGLTSEPNLPCYNGQETFTPEFFHAKDFCAKADTVKNCKKAVVVGAGKSSFDCAYALVTEGNATVDLVIRPTGDGPVWLCPPFVTPFKRMMEELLSTRALTWFSPCPWGDEDGYGRARGFLHRSGIGNFMVGNFWNTLSSDIVEAHGYNNHPELFKLKPWQSAMWTGSGVGIHNYDTNFFDLVKEGRIRVHLANISGLNGNKVNLSDGQIVETEVVICATGWKKESALTYINFDKGLRHTVEARDKLIQEADEKVFQSFPMLKNQPVLRHEAKKGEPLRNYRFIVPSQSVFAKNIAFAGMVSTVTTATFASIQGLWISAFLDGKLARFPKTDDEVVKEVMLHTQFGKWRYPCGYGASLPDFGFDSIPYVDLLMNDLGLKNHRKGSSMAELVEPYKPSDYRGLTQEWISLLAK